MPRQEGPPAQESNDGKKLRQGAARRASLVAAWAAALSALLAGRVTFALCACKGPR